MDMDGCGSAPSSTRSSNQASNLWGLRSILAEAIERLDQTSIPCSSSSVENVGSLPPSMVTPRRPISQGPQNRLERLSLFRPRAGEPQSRNRSIKKRKVSFWSHDFICLARIDQCVSPSPMDKAKLIQAGLGLKSVSFLECGGVESFHQDLLDAFPKLQEGGGFELLRSSQWGKVLDVIPMPPSGYSVPYLKGIVGQAKIYVRPMQQNLSLKINDTDGDELCPQEMCKQCGESVPLSQLRDHLSSCNQAPTERTGTSPELCSPTPPSPSPLYSPVSHQNVDLTNAEEIIFSQAIEASLENERSSIMPSLADCIRFLRQKANLPFPSTEQEWLDAPRTYIDISRSEILETTLREMRKPRFDPMKLLNVSFVNEGAIDTGGPSREFWRLIVPAIGSKYCIGLEGKMIFDRNTPALMNSEFQMLGTLVSMSIVQGGPGFPAFLPVVYDYMTTGQYNATEILNDDVPNLEVQTLLTEVCAFSLPRMPSFIAQISSTQDDMALRAIFCNDNYSSLVIDTGYRKPLTMIELSDREELTLTLRHYYTMIRGQVELDQFIVGLKTYQVLEMMQANPELMKPLFMSHEGTVLNKGFFKTILLVKFSEEGTRQRGREEICYLHFLDFLDECKDGTVKTPNDCDVTLKDVLIFFTGADRVPPLGFDGQPCLTFLHDVNDSYPTASTCSLELRLPTKHRRYREFRDNMISGLKGHGGFGVV